MTPPTDIVIPVRSTIEFPTVDVFTTCIKSVCDNTQNFRFIIVDDNSTYKDSEEIARLVSHYRNALYIRTHFQNWFTRAVNIGLRLVRTPYAVVLNSDTICHPGWLFELYAVKDEIEETIGRVGLVGSTYSEGELKRYALSTGQDYVTGHALLLHMAAMQEASYTHGTPGLYLDETSALNIHIRSDVDICWKLNRLGWQTVKSFKSHVDHHGFKSWGAQVGRVQQLRLEDVSYRYE